MSRPLVFGEDLAAIINDGMGGLLNDAELRRKVPGAAGPDPIGPRTTTTVSFPCKCSPAKRTFMKGSAANDGQAETAIRTASYLVTILGGSLPDDVSPEPEDEIVTVNDRNVLTVMTIEDVDGSPGGAAFDCVATGPV